VPYEDDIGAALQKLRQREFEAGRYNPVIPFLDFPIGPNSPSPGPKHDSIEHVLETTNEDGTRSILDMMQISSVPFDPGNNPYVTASPLADPDLIELFGDRYPSRQTVENCQPLWDRLERGMGVYVVLHANGKPHEIYFAGISFD
jgi:hypothetical protein